MSGNHPPGFPGFQSRMEQMAEQLGGDWLANRSVEQMWAEGLNLAARDLPSPLEFRHRRHYRGDFTRATDETWDKAAAYGENPYTNARVTEPLGQGEVDGFTVLWDARRLCRVGRDPDGPAILLAYAGAGHDRSAVHATDDGQALASFKGGGAYGAGFRSQTRYCKAGKEAATLAKMAQEMGVTI